MLSLLSWNRRIFLALLVAMLAALMVFSACGGGDDDDSGGSDEPAATEEQDEGEDEDEEEEEPTPDEEEEEPTPADEDEDEDDGGGSGDGEDVCALITEEEVEEITGLAVGDGENQDFDPFFSCNYSTETFDTVQVDVFHGSEEEVELYYELTEDAEEVDGIGDRAQWGGFIKQLEVLEGEYDVTIWISASTIEEDEALEMSKELAQIVLDNLD